jgi:heat shock protein HslJ
MKKVVVSSLMFTLMVVASPVAADGGMMSVPITNEPVVQPVATASYNELINTLIVSVLQMFTWKNDAGEINFTDTNYSVKYDCNTLFGSYAVDLNKVSLGTPAMTKMACAEEAMDQDDELVADLAQIQNLTFKDGQLVMTGLDTELTFTATLEETNYVGMTVEEAETAADDNGVAFRIGTLDGEELALPLDFIPGRITAEVEDNIVVDFTVE